MTNPFNKWLFSRSLWRAATPVEGFLLHQCQPPNLYLRLIKRIAFAYNSHRCVFSIYIIFPIAGDNPVGINQGAASRLRSPVYKFKLACSTFTPVWRAGDLALGICQESLCRCFNAKTSLHATWLICLLISGYLCDRSRWKKSNNRRLFGLLGGAPSWSADLFIFLWARFWGCLFVGPLFGWQHDNYTLRISKKQIALSAFGWK